MIWRNIQTAIRKFTKIDSIIYESLVLSENTLGVAVVTVALPLISASGFFGPLGGALSAAAGVLAWMAGIGIGKINNGASELYDLKAKSNLGWGWDLESRGVAGNAVDLHSMTLLTGLILSSTFKDTLTQHPELLARLFGSDYYKNYPKRSDVDNLLEVLVKGQYQGKNTLGVLSSDVNRINLQAGLTAQDFMRNISGPHGACLYSRRERCRCAGGCRACGPVQPTEAERCNAERAQVSG